MGGVPKGGKITNYLLEKSRIVLPGEGERNFHVFYFLLNGLSDAERQKYKLDHPPEFYKYLQVSGTYKVEKNKIIKCFIRFFFFILNFFSFFFAAGFGFGT